MKIGCNLTGCKLEGKNRVKTGCIAECKLGIELGVELGVSRAQVRYKRGVSKV